MILNLGCGRQPIKNAINIDCDSYEGVDEHADLSIFPWKWEDNSIDGIYMISVLEHLPNSYRAIQECHRILKPGGFVFIAVPHASLVIGVGEITHYRTFSGRCIAYHFVDYFKTEINQVLWMGFPRNNKNSYGIEFEVEVDDYKGKKLMYYILAKPFERLIQWMINQSISLFERGWCYYVGGASEVVWKGIKL